MTASSAKSTTDNSRSPRGQTLADSHWPYDDPADRDRVARQAGQPRRGAKGTQEERQVRMTAQRILANHLHPDPEQVESTDGKFWSDIDLDLTGAYLVDFSLSGCRVRVATFNHATFAGETCFREMSCEFAFIQGVSFVTGLDRDTFAADFRGARFLGDAWLAFTTFAGTPWFHADEFFCGANFNSHASFKGAVFHKGARFDGALFAEAMDLTDALTRSGDGIPHTWPPGWATRPSAHDGPSVDAGGDWHDIVPEEAVAPAGEDPRHALGHS
jgi:hypothetical protein